MDEYNASEAALSDALRDAFLLKEPRKHVPDKFTAPADQPIPPTYWTVEEASRWLTCAQPIDLKLLQKLGKDCSMVARIRGVQYHDKPVIGKRWPSERAYPVEIIREVFLANPDTAPHVPKQS